MKGVQKMEFGDVTNVNHTYCNLTSERAKEISIEFEDIQPKYNFKGIRH